MKIKNIYNSIVEGIRKKVETSGLEGIVLGFSGGVDSSVDGALAIHAIGKDRVRGLLMPFYEDEHFSDAMDVVNIYNITYHTIWINEIYDAFWHTGILWKNITKENTMARIRTDLLRAYANDHNMLVLSNMNQAEEDVGYGTKGGDTDGDYYPLKWIPKCVVGKLAEYINHLHEVDESDIFIPDNVISKPPSAGLTPGQTDEGDLGITYQDIDKMSMYLHYQVPVHGVSEKAIHRFWMLHEKAKHKRKHFEAPYINHHDLISVFGNEE